MSLVKLKQEMNQLKNPDKEKIFVRFFKTGKGDYGEGDCFLGLTVPEQRILAKKYLGLELIDVEKLLASKWHEHRLTGGLILTYKFMQAEKREEREKKNQSGEETKREIFDFYLKHLRGINNWDLVDLTADKIVGAYLQNKQKRERMILYQLAKSTNLWERRIAIIATFNFIKHKDFDDTLKISEILLNDNHDLIQKAVGWMLREIGKRDQKTEENFLHQYYQTMSRTMLRYAIEKFPEPKRQAYLKNMI